MRNFLLALAAIATNVVDAQFMIYDEALCEEWAFGNAYTFIERTDLTN